MKQFYIIVLLVIIALIIMWFFLMEGKVKRLSPMEECHSNMVQLASALSFYSAINDGSLPPIEKWCDVLHEHKQIEVDLSVFRCPDDLEGPCSYAMNNSLADTKLLNNPNRILVFESVSGWNLHGGIELLQQRHGNGSYFIFTDFSVKYVSKSEVDELKW